MKNDAPHIVPPNEVVRAQLGRIVQSPGFTASEKQKSFLEFVVDETLEGRASQIKAYTIAVAVYGRSDRFNPQEDPIVRVEAGRLRRCLENYYLTAGKNAPLRIEIPKGGYVPTFQVVDSPLPKDASYDLLAGSHAPSDGATIVVLPLVNLNGDEEQDYFADGLTEDLTVEFLRFQDFQVIASQSAMAYKSRTFDPSQVGRELGVRFVLTGGVRSGPQAVKITLRLVDTRSGQEIWGESYSRDYTAADLVGVQEEIARNVVGILADNYGLINRRLSRESRKKAPSSLKAYDAVFRFYHYENVLTPAAFTNALTALEEAVQLDPDYGLAWAMLGHLHADNYALGFCEMAAPLEKALTYAKKGVALNPENQFVQDAITLVHFHRGDKELFLKSVAETVSLNPNAPYIVGVAGWHLCLYGEWERGRALLEKGIALNPYHPSWFHLALFTDYYRQGDYEGAFAEALKFNFPKLYLDPMIRAAALGQMGKAQEAKAAINELLELVPDFADIGRDLIGRYLKVKDVIDKVIAGLQKAGLDKIR